YEVLDEIFVIIEVTGEITQRSDVLTQRLAGVVEEVRSYFGQSADGFDGFADGSAVLRQSTDQILQSGDQVVQLRGPVIDHIEDVVEIRDHLADHLILRGDLFRQRRGVRQQALHRAAFTLQHLDDLVGELVHVLRRKRGEQRSETVEQQREIHRRSSLIHRNRLVRSEFLTRRVPGPAQLEVTLPDQIQVLDGGLDINRHGDVRVQLE